MSILDVPLAFTYVTRVRSRRGLVTYLAYELLPSILVARLLRASAMAAVSCLFVGFVACYECGYLFNDRRVRPDEADGRRLHEPTGSIALFVGLRVGLAAAAAILAQAIDPAVRTSTYVALVIIVCAVLVVHSSRVVTDRGIARVGTFAALAFGKYATYLVPVVGLRLGALALLIIFVLYGFPRVVSYVIRKYGRDSVRCAAGTTQAQLQAFALAFTGPFVLPLTWSSKTLAESLAWSLWLSYAATLGSIWMYRALRQRLALPSLGADPHGAHSDHAPIDR